MLNLLIDKLIGSRDFSKKRNRDNLIKISGYLSLAINIVLFLMKISIGLLASSIAIISDAINNLTDSLSSVVTILGAKFAAKPADHDHPYGHGRSEYIASMFIGMFVLLVGFELLINSVKNVINPKDINTSVFTIIILIISIGLKFYMYLFNNKVYRLSDSLLNKTVARDAVNDILATSMVLISSLLTPMLKINLDGIVGLLISLIIIKSGIEIFTEIGNILLGKKVDDKIIEEIEDLILSKKYVRGVHKIDIHEYGKGRMFGSCHMEVPANIDVYSMHGIVDEVENEIREKLGIDMSIHVDPSYLLEKDKFKKIEDESVLDDIDK